MYIIISSSIIISAAGTGHFRIKNLLESNPSKPKLLVGGLRIPTLNPKPKIWAQKTIIIIIIIIIIMIIIMIMIIMIIIIIMIMITIMIM